MLSPCSDKAGLSSYVHLGGHGKAPSRPPFKNGLAAQLWGVWSADGHQLPAHAGPASEVPRATWPRVTPFLGQPASSDRAQREQGHSPQTGALTVNTLTPVLGPGRSASQLTSPSVHFFSFPLLFTGVHPHKHHAPETSLMSASREATLQQSPESLLEFFRAYRFVLCQLN